MSYVSTRILKKKKKNSKIIYPAYYYGVRGDKGYYTISNTLFQCTLRDYSIFAVSKEIYQEKGLSHYRYDHFLNGTFLYSVFIKDRCQRFVDWSFLHINSHIF